MMSPEHAEVLACKKALEFVVAHSFAPAKLVTDASEVQLMLSNPSAANTPVLKGCMMTWELFWSLLRISDAGGLYRQDRQFSCSSIAAYAC